MAYVFVIITSKTCGHCVTFKEQHMNKLLEDLSSLPNLSIINVSLPDRDMEGFGDRRTQVNSVIGAPTNDSEKKYGNNKTIYYIQGGNVGFNLKCIKYVRGYPQFLLFPKNLWMSQRDELAGWAFNGVIVPGVETRPNKTASPINAKTLSSWILENIGTTVQETKPKVEVRSPLGYLTPNRNLKLNVGGSSE
jgi:hypothetical protein